MSLSPSTITLVPSPGPLPPEVEAQVANVLAHGFAEVGRFSVDAFPSVRLAGFIHASGTTCAAVCDGVGMGAGIWFDVVAERADDGVVVTVTTNETGGGLTPRKVGFENRYLDVDASVAEAMAVLDETLGDGPRRPVSADGFASYFEEVYRRQESAPVVDDLADQFKSKMFDLFGGISKELEKQGVPLDEPVSDPTPKNWGEVLKTLFTGGGDDDPDRGPRRK